jgi:hypothetical protein
MAKWRNYDESKSISFSLKCNFLNGFPHLQVIEAYYEPKCQNSCYLLPLCLVSIQNLIWLFSTKAFIFIVDFYYQSHEFNHWLTKEVQSISDLDILKEWTLLLIHFELFCYSQASFRWMGAWLRHSFKFALEQANVFQLENDPTCIQFENRRHQCVDLHKKLFYSLSQTSFCR